MKVSFNHKGDFSKTIDFLTKSSKGVSPGILDKFGREGVEALSRSTPIESGVTAESWNYKIKSSGNVTSISWYNSNVVNGVSIAVVLQYGHGTQNGGWIEGRDYINPAMRPIFDKLAEEAYKEVTK